MTTTPNKVTVRVEVVVEGGQTTVVTDEIKPGVGGRALADEIKHGVVTRLIKEPNPNAGGNWAVTPKSGGNVLNQANGQAPPLSSGFAKYVLAKAFNRTNMMSPYPRPDSTWVSGTVGATTGEWWVYNIPGSGCDSTSGGEPNSTLIVYYSNDNSTPLPNPDSTVYHGYNSTCPRSSSLSPDHTWPVQKTMLKATFTGALAALHTIHLNWNGVSWVGEARGAGSSVLSLTSNGPFFQLAASGPGTSFVVAAQLSSHAPFELTASGNALGNLAGPFKVTITE
jgi:hypothetical protein